MKNLVDKSELMLLLQAVNGCLWKTAAKIIASPAVVRYLLKRAMRTPYTHIAQRGSQEVYMYRWWLFNPYVYSDVGSYRRFPRLPSIRLHHIMLADDAKHLHDHPWAARTIILHGFYIERRLASNGNSTHVVMRKAGETATLRQGLYHSIDKVPVQGVLTLFMTWGPPGAWGFNVNGKNVNRTEYLKQRNSK